MTLVILAGGIDLSVGSVMALSAVVTSLAAIHWNWPAPVVIALAMAVGAACGAVSGTLVSGLGMQPFVGTLAMMVFARGLAKWITGGTRISTAVPRDDGTFEFADVPQLFQWIDSRWFGDSVSVVSLIFIACWLVMLFLLRRHVWGRYIYAIGGSSQAATYSGVPVTSSRLLTYVASGMLAGMAGLCQAAQEQQGDPEVGATYELTAIAMVVIGGTALTGGRGGLGLTFIGILAIGYLEKILSINAVSESGRLMLTAVIIVTAVLTQRQRADGLTISQ